MAFDKLNFTNATSNILAMAIQDDARDTLSKVTDAYVALSPLLGMSIREKLDTEDYNDLVSYIGQGITLALEDGDCVILNVIDGSIMARTTGPDATENHNITLIDSTGVVKQTIFTDISANSFWTIDEVIASLAHQAQSATIFSRLAGVCASQDVRQADVMACFSDISGNLTPEVHSLRSNLLNLGANLSQASILGMLQSSYVSIAGASTTNNTINFADNDFKVSGYCGTVLKQMMTSAASVLGQILLVSGGIVGRIAGVTLMGLGMVGNAISTAANAMASTVATYNPVASQYEFAQRLFKGKVIKTYVNAAIKARLDESRVCLIRYPAFNIYIWDNPNDSNHYYYEAYAGLMLDKIPEYNQDGHKTTMYRVVESVENGVTYKSLYVSMDATPDPGSNQLGAYPFIKAVDYFSDSNGAYSQWIDIPSDEEMRRRVTLSLAAAYFQFLNLRRYTSGDVQDYKLTGFLLRRHQDADVPEEDSNSVLWNFFVRGKVPSWEGLVNHAIPHLQLWLDTLPETPVGLGLFSGHGSEGILSMDGSITSCPSFRSSYLVTPPNYTPGAVIGAIAITLGSVAALTASYFVAKTIANKALTKQAVKRYERVQNQLDKWRKADAEHKESALNSYLKEVRKYNKFAKFAGISSINAVNGYEDSSDAALPQVTDSTTSTLLSNLVKFQDDNYLNLQAIAKQIVQMSIDQGINTSSLERIEKSIGDSDLSLQTIGNQIVKIDTDQGVNALSLERIEKSIKGA